MARRRGWSLNQGDAFVLGAGFSRAISDHLPLLQELGRVVADALATQGYDVHELEEAFQYDFESWLSYLAQGGPQLSESDNLRNQALFLDASFQIARTLALRVRQALQDEPISWLQKLIELWHEQRTSVVSFNYDTLVEEMFHRTIRRTDGSRIHHGNLYVLQIPMLGVLSGGLTFGPEEVETFKLAKLHGSLNWVYSGDVNTRGELVFDSGISQGWDATRTDVAGEAPSLTDRVPMIVPPTSSKSLFFNNAVIRSQWTLARHMLRQARRIIVLGYSLPKTDHLVRPLLAEATKDKPLIVVDSSAETVGRYAESLPTAHLDRTYSGHADVVRAFIDSYGESS